MIDSQKTTMRNGLLLAALFSVSSLSAATINVVPGDNLQDSINAASSGDTLLLGAGVYSFEKSLVVSNPVIIEGEDKESVILKTTDDSVAGNTVTLKSGATLRNVTVTRGGNTVDSWIANKNNTGVAFNQLLSAETTLEDCIIEHNRNGVYANNSEHVVIRNNIIRNNRTGIGMANGVGFTIIGNDIKDNTTIGVVHYINTDEKLLTAAKVMTGNTITGNWYSQVEIRIPADKGYSLDLSNNEFGTGNTVACAFASGEPKYDDQIPEWAGGDAVPPAGAPTIIVATPANVTLPATFPTTEFVFFPQFSATELAYSANHVPQNATIKIFPGQYPVIPNDTLTFVGQAGWYLPIGTEGLTLVGVDSAGVEVLDPANAPLIYGDKYTANGIYSSQNFISAFADNVTIKGLRIMSKIEQNKSILIQGQNARLENLSLEPNTLSDTTGCPDDVAENASKFCGSIYFYRDATNSDTSIGDATLKNVTLTKGFLSAWNYNSKAELGGTLNLINTTVDFRGCLYAGNDTDGGKGYYKATNLSPKLSVNPKAFTVQADPKAFLLEQVLAPAPAKTTVELAAGTYQTGTIVIPNKDLTIIGSGTHESVIETAGANGWTWGGKDLATVILSNLKFTGTSNYLVTLNAKCSLNSFSLLNVVFDRTPGSAMFKVGSTLDAKLVSVKDCVFQNGAAGIYSADGSAVEGVEVFAITNTSFSNMSNRAFHIEGADSVVVYNCRFNNAGQDPLANVTSIGLTKAGNTFASIDSCYFAGNIGSAVGLCTTATSPEAATTMKLTNSIFTANAPALSLMGTRTQDTFVIAQNQFLGTGVKMTAKPDATVIKLNVTNNYWGSVIPDFSAILEKGEYTTSPYFTNSEMTETASNVFTWTAPESIFVQDVVSVKVAGTNGKVALSLAADSKDSAIINANGTVSFVKEGNITFIGTPVWGDKASTKTVSVTKYVPAEALVKDDKIILTTDGTGTGTEASPGRITQLEDALTIAAEVEVQGSVFMDEPILIPNGKVLSGDAVIYGSAVIGAPASSSPAGFNRAQKSVQLARAVGITFDGSDSSVAHGVVLHGILDSCIVQNYTSADNDGAGVLMYTNALIVNSLIRNNTAKNGGGVAMNGTDTAIIVNSILTNNTAVDSGGAVFGAADLINCIVANNKAEEGSAAANAKLFNTVIFGNDNKDSMLFESAISYCAIDSAIVPATNIAITDAQFVKPTTFKGADTALINEVTAANWAPQQNATLLVDLGNNQDIMGVGITKDIAGKARIVHTNPLITETIVDIGAYECQIPVNEAPIVIGASVTGDTFEYGYDITMDSAFYSVTATFNGEPIPADSMTYKVTFASATDTFVAPAMLVPGTYGATIVAVEKFTGSVSYANVVTVNKADLQGLENVIATAITYGQPQTDAVLSGTAVSKTGLVVAGTLEWENPEVKPHAGTVTKDILFAPTDSNLYNNFASTGSLVVNKAAQTLTVSPANMVVSIGESKPITANASSGLSASFAANNDNVSVDSVGSVTGAKIGMSVVTVTQDGVNGGYSDYVSVSKTVTVQTISNIPATITIADTTLTFNADTQVAAISVTVGGAPVIPDTMIIEYVSTTDSTVRFGATGPTNADTYILTVIADSGIDFWGKAESEFVINPFMIAADSLVIADTAQVYSGNAAVVSVIIDSTMLPKQIVPVVDTDYKVTYSPDTVVNVGSYEVAVQFTGNYAGSDTAMLVIAPFAVAADSVLITNTQQVFTGTPKSVVVTVLTIPSPSAAEYTVTYSGSSVLPIAVGSYPVAVTLSGNFTGSATATLNIISNNPYPNSAEIGIQAPGTEMVIPSNILGLPSLDKKPKTVATYTKPFGKVGAKPSKLSVKLNDYEVGADTLYLDVKGTVLLYNKKEYNSLRKTMFTQDILKSNPAIQQDSAVVTVTFSVKNVEADSNVTILMVPPTINADSIFEVSILNGTKADSYFVIYGENFGTKAKAWFEYKDLNGKMKKKGLSVVKKAMSADGKSFVKGAKPTVQQLDSMMILKYNKIVDDPTIMRLDLTIDNKNGLDAVSVFALPLSN